MTPEKIILHHSATADSETVSWGAIRRYHVNECAWGDIGYHFGIEYVGGDPEILIGRMPDQDGAHTKGENQRALGICFVGNFDTHTPSDAIWQAGLKLVRWLCAQYGIPYQKVYGHNAFANKTCPGTMFSVEKFRADLAKGG